MEALLVSTFVVALAEIGDKTQLLAIVLASKFKKPLPIIAGILTATLANHALAATVGYLVSDILQGRWFRILVAVSFIAMALWALIPDKEEDIKGDAAKMGVYVATTVALGARFHSIAWVAAGTTIGMMLANVPAVYLGEAATKIVPLKYVRMGAAVIFAGLGLWTLIEALKG